jgi:class 3 adenylate cyclase
MAAQMADAIVDPSSGDTAAERYRQTNEAITAFFTAHFAGARPATREPRTAPTPSSSAVILFIDLAESTALTERMGDVPFRSASRALDERLRAVIRDAGGVPVEGKVMGDGVMATFGSAREAIDAALRCNTVSSESELRLHIGVHAGDVIREPGNVYGGAVNIAARICDASAPGEVLVSDVVRGMARTSAGVMFEDRGEREMKGVGEPVRVYAVRPT